ncbi:MAG: hypothetical protein AAF541_24270 [Pseudomonadota bacterium]
MSRITRNKISMVRHGSLLSRWFACLMVTSLLSTAVYAEGYIAPRGADGVHPDLNGIWQALNTANYNIEMHTASHSMQLREGPMGPLPAVKTLYLGAVGAVPPGLGVVVEGTIPYTPEAEKIRDENKANWIDRDPEIKCFLPGVPRATYMPQPFQIFQSKDSVFIAYQYAGATREIYMEDPGEAPVDSWMGWSHGTSVSPSQVP